LYRRGASSANPYLARRSKAPLLTLVAATDRIQPEQYAGGSQPASHDIGYDCITELWVKDEAALAEVARIFSDPVINPILAADELKFLQRDATVMIVSEEIDTGTQLAA
jgi:hypothetical protein